MGFGIIVYECSGRFYPFIMADDIIYNGMKQKMSGYGMNFLNGKNNISGWKINKLEKKVCDLVKRKNMGESLNLNKELESIFEAK